MLELAQRPKEPQPVKAPPRDRVEPPTPREPNPEPNPAPIDEPEPAKPREVKGRSLGELAITRLLRLEEIREAARRMRLADAPTHCAEPGVSL